MHVCSILGIIKHLLWIHRWLRRLLTSRLCRVSTHYCWENLISATHHMAYREKLTSGMSVFPCFLLFRSKYVLRNQLPQEACMISSGSACW
jgi:hypothetical protein